MNIIQNHQPLAEDILTAAHRFYRLQYQMSDGGNLSARIPGTPYMMVKATNVDFGSLNLETLVVTDFEGHKVEGEAEPSKESLLHGAIYAACPDVGAVMHCHSPYATAWAAHHDTLDFSTHHAKIKLGGHCPVLDTNSYVVPPEYFGIILEEIKKHPKMLAFLLRGHGQVAMGKTMHKAALIAELVEETAMIARLSAL